MRPLKLPSGNCASNFTGLICTLMLDAPVINVHIALSRTQQNTQWNRQRYLAIDHLMCFSPTSGPQVPFPEGTVIARASELWKECPVSLLELPLTNVNSTTVDQSIYQQVFTKFGLPRLLIVDTGSKFQATLEDVAELLYIKIVILPPEFHHAQRCERFQRFLNKVVLIMTQD
jgi:hypothetical protein